MREREMRVELRERERAELRRTERGGGGGREGGQTEI